MQDRTAYQRAYYESHKSEKKARRKPQPRTEAVNPKGVFEAPPYHVESFPGLGEHEWHCVCNKHGFNCLSFADAPGRKFTTLEDATIICELWNMSSSTTQLTT